MKIRSFLFFHVATAAGIPRASFSKIGAARSLLDALDKEAGEIRDAFKWEFIDPIMPSKKDVMRRRLKEIDEAGWDVAEYIGMVYDDYEGAENRG